MTVVEWYFYKQMSPISAPRFWMQGKSMPMMSLTHCFKTQMASSTRWCSRRASRRQQLYWKQPNR